MPRFVRVAALRDLPPGHKTEISVDGVSLLLVNVDGELFAVDDLCTHEEASLAEGDVVDHQIVCPRHHARFDLRTGAALSMPAFEPLATYAVKVEDGDVYVESF